jgi:prophage regulatory protein
MSEISRFIREEECRRITGLGRTTRWEMEKTGLFPKRKKLGKRAAGWLLSEVEDWVQNRSFKSS